MKVYTEKSNCDMDLPQRKINRLTGYDYSTDGINFVTVCTHAKQKILCDIVGAQIIRQFKGKVTKQLGTSIWQKSFHDHVIRNEDDYRRIWEYVDTNPQKWTDVCYYTP